MIISTLTVFYLFHDIVGWENVCYNALSRNLYTIYSKLWIKLWIYHGFKEKIKCLFTIGVHKEEKKWERI
jgi:hypothetical protein